MDTDSFTKLALRVLANEATEGDQRSLKAELALNAARQEEFEQIKITHDILRTAMPMAEAVQAREPELPAYRLNELRSAVRQHFKTEAIHDKEAASARSLKLFLRWLLAGGGATALAMVVILVCFANRSIEIGLYQTDQVRSEGTPLAPEDVPSARLVTFDQDTPFDQWQSQPLAWYEHAKIWVDNEHDLLHVVRRINHGQVVTETRPLAPTTEGQRDQIKQAVETLQQQ